MQRLTDFWEGLYGGTTRNANESIRERDRFERIERVSEAFKNLYWTRIISLQADETQRPGKYEMTSDILEALNEIDEASDLDSLGHQVFFDPRAFVIDNPAPTRDEFKLSNEDLLHWAYRCSWVREHIREKIKAHKQDQGIIQEQNGDARTRKGQRLSKPKDNIENLSE